MAYLGRFPAPVPLSSDDLGNGIVINRTIANGAVTVNKISANGTPLANTFLSGTGDWSSVSSAAATGPNSSVQFKNITGTDAAGTANVTIVETGINPTYVQIIGTMAIRRASDNANVIVFTPTSGNITAAGNIAAAGVLTDQLYYSNGQPYDFQQPAGSNNQVQYNAGGNFGASSNFTWDNANAILAVAGTVNATTVNAGTINGNLVGATVSAATIGNTGATITGATVTASGNVTSTNVNATNFYGNIRNTTGGYNDVNVAAYLSSNTNLPITTSSNVTTTANISGTYLLGNGAFITGLPSQYSNSNVAAYLPTYTGNIGAGNVAATGNISASYILGNGAFLTGLPSQYSNANVAAYLPIYNGNILASNITIANNAIINGNLSVLGNTTTINANSLIINDKDITIANGAVNATQANGAGILIDGADVEFVYNSTANVMTLTHGLTSAATVAAQTLTSAGGITAVGDITAGNVVSANYFLGNGSLLTGINASNLVGGYGNSNVAAYLPVYTGNLTSLTGNIVTGANISGSYLLGNGRDITGLPVASQLANGITSLSIPTANAPITGTLSLGGDTTTILLVGGLSVVVGGQDVSPTATGITAVGARAGWTGQGQNATAVGFQAGETNQGVGAVAVGLDAGETNQGVLSVAVGEEAGRTSQGDYAVALGYRAGNTNQATKSIVLNATGAALDTSTANSFVVKPIRNATAGDALYYNSTSGEITYGTPAATYGNSNVAAYLPTYTGNLVSLTGNVITTANVSGAFLLGNIRSATGGYDDANVAAYLPTANVNILSNNLIAGNIIVNDNITVTDNAVIQGNLQVLGTTTTINANSLSIADKDIIIANGALTTSQANGAGLIVGDANNLLGINIVYLSPANVWSIQPGITTSGNVTAGYFLGNITQATGYYSNANVATYLPTYTGNLASSSDIIALYANAATQSNAIVAINANVAGANAEIANLWSNAATQSNAIANLQNLQYANANVAAYLASNANITITVGTSDITTQGNIAVGNANVSGQLAISNISQFLAPGGTSRQFITTDGAGNLSFSSAINLAEPTFAPSQTTSTLTSNVTDGVTQIRVSGLRTQYFVNGSLFSFVNGAAGYDNFYTVTANSTYNGAETIIDFTPSLSGGPYFSGANVYVTGVALPYSVITFTGGVTANVTAAGALQVDVAAAYSNANVATYLASNANITVTTLGNITTQGNVSGSYILGNIRGTTGGYTNANVISLLGGYANAIATSANITVSGANLDVYRFAGSGGFISANGISVGANGIVTTGNVSAGNTVSANYFIGSGALLTGINAGNLIGAYGNANVADYLASNANVVITTLGNITTQGNVSGSYILGNIRSATGGYGDANVAAYTGALTSLTGNITTTANISGAYLLGNGAFITGLPAQYGNSNVAAYLPTYSGNVGTGAGYILGNGSALTGVFTTVRTRAGNTTVVLNQ